MKSSKPKKGNYQYAIEPDMIPILHLLYMRGVTLNQLANYHNVSRQLISKKFKENGYETRRGGYRKDVDHIEDSMLYEMHQQAIKYMKENEVDLDL